VPQSSVELPEPGEDQELVELLEIALDEMGDAKRPDIRRRGQLFVLRVVVAARRLSFRERPSFEEESRLDLEALEMLVSSEVAH
jgi:hypothetical protein